MTPPIVLTNHSTDQASGRSRRYVLAEQSAAKRAGFRIVPANANAFGVSSDVTLGGERVLVRCYSEEEAGFERYIVAAGGQPIIPSADQANGWYRVITGDDQQVWLGRRIRWLDLGPYNYLDEQSESEQLDLDLGAIIDDVALEGAVFIKSSTKHNLCPMLTDQRTAISKVRQSVAMFCHRRPTELILSEPIDIAPSGTAYRVKEYRCFVVDGVVSTASRYTDKRANVDYSEVVAFAAAFAERFTSEFPRGYCLDIARLTSGRLVVIELNDIWASGFFADHDLDLLFADLYRLAS